MSPFVNDLPVYLLLEIFVHFFNEGHHFYLRYAVHGFLVLVRNQQVLVEKIHKDTGIGVNSRPDHLE